MKSVRLVAAALFGLLSSLSIVHCLRDYDVYYKWKRIEYNIPPNVRLNSSEYIPENNIIGMMKIYKDRIFITTPRMFPGVPVTLSTLPYDRHYSWWHPFVFLHDESPKLQPFPNYKMNKLGDCNAMQHASAVEIDQFGRLWVLDAGKINVLAPIILAGLPETLCPVKLRIFNVKNGRSDLIFTYTFPEEVAPSITSYLKEIQVACRTVDECFAFITDFPDNKIVVYDHKNQESWTATHPSLAPDLSKIIFSVDGIPFPVPVGINNIALAPRKHNFSDLYFSPLSSTTLFRVKTESLMNPLLKQNGELNMDDVLNVGELQGQSDGFIMSSKGELFYGCLPDNSVISTKTTPQYQTIVAQNMVAQNDVDLLWPKGMAFDGKGNLAVNSVRFHILDKTNPNEYNYRILLLKRTGKVYAYNKK